MREQPIAVEPLPSVSICVLCRKILDRCKELGVPVHRNALSGHFIWPGQGESGASVKA